MKNNQISKHAFIIIYTYYVLIQSPIYRERKCSKKKKKKKKIPPTRDTKRNGQYC